MLLYLFVAHAIKIAMGSLKSSSAFKPNSSHENMATLDTKNKSRDSVSPSHLGFSHLGQFQRRRDWANSRREELMDALDNHLQQFVDELLQEPSNEVDFQNNNSALNSFHTIDRQNNEDGEYRLPAKKFIARNSVLTELLELSHFRALYHIFVAVLLMLAMSSLITDLFDGREILRVDLVTWTFGRMPDVVMTWLGMHLAAIVVVYPGFYYWAYNRGVAADVTAFDMLWVFLYIVYLVGLVVRPLCIVFETNMPPASSIIVVSEQIRLIMKSHAFVRENVHKAYSLAGTPSREQDGQAGTEYKEVKLAAEEDDLSHPCPSFSRYLYFLFAPTLVYRDVYPRTTRIRWEYVVSNVAQVFGCFVYLYYVFARFLWPEFEAFRAEHVTMRSFLISSFHCMLPGGLILLITFFALLHSWHNAFAEMLRFADRLFYRDWWNSTSFSGYYRTWNMLVHDWLYSYVYRDAYRLFRGDRTAAAAVVFLLSSVVHEYVITVALRFFYPVLFVMFMGAGFAFTFFRGRSRSWNIFLFWALFSGMGFLSCFYSMEWYARRNCPLPTEASLWLQLLPRTFTCGSRLTSS